jgi:membrane fusion protein (multidrug efflux system)
MSENGNGNGAVATAVAPSRTMTAASPEAFGQVEPSQGAAPPAKRGKKPMVFLILGIVLVAGITGGILWWLEARNYESTDDAFIGADVTQVSPRISGHVQTVYVTDNQFVKAGDKIIELDPKDLQSKVNQAKAAVDSAQASVQQAQDDAASQAANVGQAKASEQASETEAKRAHSELERFEKLSNEAVTQQQITNYRAAAQSADANLAAAKQKTVYALASVKSAESLIRVKQADVEQSQAQLNSAELQLSYTTVRAPVAGHVTNKAVQPGDYVQPGQALTSLVPQDVYVTANFKETQLTLMKPGQDADITVDAYPGYMFHGKVESIQRGSGSAFSLLPPENATGNYVKVVQRVPVKIPFQTRDETPLGPGMSAVPKVKVR